MRIENISFENIKILPDVELRNLRIRFIDIFDRYFIDSAVKKAVDIGRQAFYNKYIILRAEMTGRGMKFLWNSLLDKDISNHIFKSSMWDLDVPAMGEVAIVPEYVSVGGSFIKSPKDAEDIDIIIRDSEENRDESFELKVGRLIREQTKKEPHFVYAPKGPHSSYIPLFDLVLRSRDETKKVRVKESTVAKELTPTQRKECDEEIERIKENREKAEWPHKFKPAKYTHPNGHPRCLICGDEERTDGVCRKTDVEKESREYFEGLDNWDKELKTDNAEVIKSLAEGSVLDLGCGGGRLLKELKDAGRKVFGVDVNDIALEMCGEKGIDAKKADLEKGGLPFDNDSFDNVVSVHSFEHLDHPEHLIHEAWRIAKERVVVLSPLGERLDPTHKREFKELKDFKKCFGEAWDVKKIEETNSAIAVLDISKVKKVALMPFGRFIPPKPTMAGLTEAFSVEEIWNWAKDKFPLDVEEKLNGFRFIIEKAGDKVRLKTEGDKDRTKQLAPLAEALKKIPDDFIIDCSMGIERDGKALPRIRLMTLMADEPELKEGDVIKATMFDLPYWKEDLHEKPLSERRRSLEAFYGKYLKSIPHFGLTSYNVVEDRKGLEQQFRKLAQLPQSEGILIKTLDGKWDTDGSCETWAKIKREAEIKVIALERHDVKGGNYNYSCGLLPGDSGFENLTEFRGEKYIDLGKCFNTKIKAELGDILTMGVEEVIPQEKKLQWLGARVLDIDKDRKEPYFAKQAMDIAERANVLQKARYKRTQCMSCPNPPNYEILWAEGRAHAWFCEKHFKEWINEEHDKKNFSGIDSIREIQNNEANKNFKDNSNPNIKDQLKEKFKKAEEGGIDYKVGDKGKGVLQLHIMGIEEEKIDTMKKRSQEAVRARHNPLMLKMLLKGAIGEHGCHIDLRMVRKGDRYFEGGEIMVGNLSGLDKLKKLEQGGKLRFGWKVPRKEEPQAETIRGPVDWMDVGKGRIEIFPPGEAGATAKLHGAMLLLDSFEFEAVEPQDDHAKKFEFKGNKLIPEGTYLMAYVPVTEAGKKGERVWMISKLKEEEEEAKKQRQKLNSPMFAYKAIYGKLPEEPLAGRTGSPKKNWKGLEVDKHIKDEWLEQLNSIDRIEIRSTDEGKSEERVAFVVFRMSDPREDTEAEAVSEKLDGTKSLYSLCDIGAEGRPRIVVAGKVMYGKSDWEEWWNDLAGKIQEALESIRKLDLEQFRAEGMDEDIASPKKRYRELIADLRYLGNSGYPKLKADQEWGEWKLTDILKYYAKIVDALRSIYFPIMSPKLEEKKFNTSYWRCYRDARKYMKIKPPKEDETKEWDKKRQQLIGKSQLSTTLFKITKVDKAKQIIGGVVYEPDEVDTQGDYTDVAEIEKAMNLFMKKYATDTKRIRINHKGRKFFFPILEVFQPEEDTIKGGKVLKKGAWWLSIHITNKDIWKDIEENRLTGFSMGGRAKA